MKQDYNSGFKMGVIKKIYSSFDTSQKKKPE